jgi:Uma2 family endonuclease
MSTATTKTRFTPADLLAMPRDISYELVDGLLVEKPVSVLSSLIAGIIYHMLFGHCLSNRLGLVLPPETGYQCFPDSPDKVRKPDVSFIRAGRLTREQLMEEGFCSVVPDLAVEVLSPNDLVYVVDQKVREYRRAGVLLTWIVNPETRTVKVYRADRPFAELEENDELSGEEVVPGFRVVIRDIFELAEKATLSS